MFIDELKQGLPPEDQHLEYVSVIVPPSTMAREIAAFANADGGYIVFGVLDDMTVQGIHPLVPASAVVEEALERLQTRPRLQYYNEKLEGKRIYIIEVEKSPVPIITNNNVTYTREGTKVQRDPPIIEEPFVPSGNPTMDALLLRLREMGAYANY
ncbi:MAG: ATP-binding protein [Chloroflexota bacterium]|nr:ATP-binding protein [Chloroflexota bacterium]